jgi:hypothetical protein
MYGVGSAQAAVVTAEVLLTAGAAVWMLFLL